MPQSPAKNRDRWSTRIGLVLAMAGNAVGLGNFLRFPVQAAQNGGGTFMIPYVISLLLLGIPLMWIEWGVGRLGGRHGRGSLPRMLDLLTDRRKSWPKYLGVIGLVIPTVVFSYYTFITSWMLGFSFFSLIGDYFGNDDVESMRGYLASYQNIHDGSSHGGWIALIFFAVTMFFIARVLARGISGGIEKLALIGMPLLFFFALVLMVRVLTLPAVVASPADGLNFIWNPVWSELGHARVWLAAAGQVFFTLSVGVGSIQTYASYLGKDDDIVLTGLSTAATNEFAEVILGGTIAIPAAVVFFGVAGATAIAQGGSFDLGIVAMGVVFQGLPGGELLGRLVGFLWFFLLFIAGVTSCVAVASPAIAFIHEEFPVSRRSAAAGIGVLGLLGGLFHLVFYRHGSMAEWDYWAGTFGLVIFATLEVFLFAWVFGMRRGWEELHLGAEMRIPGIYRPIMQWVTPAFLVVLLSWWSVTEAVPVFLMEGVAAADVPYRWVSRLMIVILVAVGLILIRRAWAQPESGDAHRPAAD